MIQNVSCEPAQLCLVWSTSRNVHKLSNSSRVQRKPQWVPCSQDSISFLNLHPPANMDVLKQYCSVKKIASAVLNWRTCFCSVTLVTEKGSQGAMFAVSILDDQWQGCYKNVSYRYGCTMKASNMAKRSRETGSPYSFLLFAFCVCVLKWWNT